MSQSLVAKVLECLLCTKAFSLEDVALGRFFPSTGICRSCYKEGQRSSRKVWCFGKEDLVKDGKVVLKAFDPDALECSLYCPDRLICKAFIKEKEQLMAKKREDEDEDVEELEDEEEAEADEEDTDSDDDDDSDDDEEEEEPKKKKKKKSKSDDDEDEEESEEEDDDSEDEEEEEDSEEEDDEDEPKKKSKEGKMKDKKKKKGDDEDVKNKKKGKEEKSSKKGKKDKGEKKKRAKTESTTPYKPGSIIHQAFEMAMSGAAIKDIEKFVKKEGGNAQRVIRILKSGEAYDKSWKVDENKGRLKIKYNG